MSSHGLIKFRNKGFCAFVIFKYPTLDIFFKKITLAAHKAVFSNS